MTLSTGTNVTVINRGINFLVGYALFVAGLVTFKFVFALLYTLKWNCRYWFKPYYRKSTVDVADAFKNMRKDKNGAISTDEDEDED